jgi:two-component system nitrate/nitrite response regulator NarL
MCLGSFSFNLYAKGNLYQMIEELRILLADKQERVRYALRALLRQQPGWTVIGEADNAKDLLALASVMNPNLVLLDWNLPDLKGKQTLISLRRICIDSPVIILSGQDGDKNAALKAGANDFFSKVNSPDQLVKIIQNVMNFKKRR